jgi:hypothetical protein
VFAYVIDPWYVRNGHGHLSLRSCLNKEVRLRLRLISCFSLHAGNARASLLLQVGNTSAPCVNNSKIRKAGQEIERMSQSKTKNRNLAMDAEHPLSS